MDTRLPYWGSIIFSTIALILLVINVSMANTNRNMQVDIQTRQSIINGGQTFNQLNQGLIQAIAEAATKGGDTQMRDLLSAQGIQVKTENGPINTAPADKK
jgi:hypothetical protein